MSRNSDSYHRQNQNSNHLKGGESHRNEAQPPNKTRKGPSDPVFARPLEVKVYDGNVERAIKTFRMAVQKDRILSLYKEKQAYEKPSMRKRRKRNEYIRNLKEEARKGKEHDRK